MKINQLTTTRPKSANRVGRGIAAGKGKTAGRGTKGQRSRTGSSRKPGFEGGQNPIMQRLPKLPGFRSFATRPEVVYTGELEQFAGMKVTNQTLADAGLISNPFVTVKVVLKGDITKKVQVEVQGATSGAKTAIEAAGGSFSKTARNARPVTSQKKLDRVEADKK